MATELITGQGSTDHINSEDIGAYQARTFGTGAYILNGCECAVIDSNTVRISKGEILVEGRHVRVKGSEDLTLRSGTTGRNRNDLIVVKYTRDSSSIEDAPLVVITGTATEGAANDPSYVSGSILDGHSAADFPLYRIPIAGLVVGQPALMMRVVEPFIGHKHSFDDIPSGTLPMNRGGTGATTAAGARNALGLGNTTGALPVANGGTGVTTDAAIALKSYPVGSVYVSYTSTSPASRFGGTWTAITGRFPYFNAGTGTGGSNTHTLSTGEIPSHSHASSNGNPLVATTPSSVMPAIANSNNTIAFWYAQQVNLTSTGGSGSHNNMPAYQTLYAWRRTA